MKQLLETSLYSDIVFLVEGKRVEAHKNVICCRCEYFSGMFSVEHGMKESKGIHIFFEFIFSIYISFRRGFACLIFLAAEVPLEDVSYSCFVEILKFLYSTKISIIITIHVSSCMFISSHS